MLLCCCSKDPWNIVWFSIIYYLSSFFFKYGCRKRLLGSTIQRPESTHIWVSGRTEQIWQKTFGTCFLSSFDEIPQAFWITVGLIPVKGNVIQNNKEKKIEIWLSLMTKARIPTEKKTNSRYQNATHNFDNTTIADRLRTVSWSNNSHPTSEM